jgi:hypothetical protein
MPDPRVGRSDTPAEHTDLDDVPRAQCSECGRKSWEAGMIGHVCYVPQPDGSTCSGVFIALRSDR